MIGHRLRMARAAAGLSLRDLETKIANLVTAQALSKYEQDEMMPGSQVLIAIAKALGVSEDYLLSEQEMSLDGVEFRRKAKMSAKEQAQVEAQVLHLFDALSGRRGIARPDDRVGQAERGSLSRTQ
jgi:transcriptional regulator with XRE-family HTH domain